jgi:hypothetical protein
MKYFRPIIQTGLIACIVLFAYVAAAQDSPSFPYMNPKLLRG